MSSNAATPPPFAPRPSNPLGLVAVILAVVGFGIAFIAPVAFLAWFLTLPAFILGIIGWTRKNRPKATSIAGTSLSTVAFILSLVLFSVYVAGQPTAATTASSDGNISHHVSSGHSAAPKAPAPTPTPTPTPVTTPVPNAASMSPSAAEAALTAAGLTFKFESTGGVAESHVSGWKIVKETPAAGTAVQAGTVVVITVTPPPPPPVVHHVVPVAPSHPAGASAKCRDGTFSYSAHRSGTCSHHGGVAIWY